jgi:secondary thiamine-phosphate synthase enzyme
MIQLLTIHRQTTSNTDILDITADVQACVSNTGIHNGIAIVGVAGSTASVTTIEYERGVVDDLRRAVERIAPADIAYAHDARWGDGNGHAHVRAALLGPSTSVPIQEGRLVLGTWQQLVLCDFDNRPRRREVYVQAMGE